MDHLGCDCPKLSPSMTHPIPTLNDSQSQVSTWEHTAAAGRVKSDHQYPGLP